MRWVAYSTKHILALKTYSCSRHHLDDLVTSMKESLSELSVELVPIHERLVTLRRQLVALAAKDTFSKAELKPIQEELRKIDSLSITFTFSLPCRFLLFYCSPMITEATFAFIPSFLQKTRRRQVPRTRWLLRPKVPSNLLFPSRRMLRDRTRDQSARRHQERTVRT